MNNLEKFSLSIYTLVRQLAEQFLQIFCGAAALNLSLEVYRTENICRKLSIMNNKGASHRNIEKYIIKIPNIHKKR